MANKWVLLLDSPGATGSGTVPTLDVLAAIATVCEAQLNADYGPLCGEQDASVRASDGTDIQVDEKRYIFMTSLPDAPGASAYHVPGAAYCAVSTCQDFYGPNGLSVDASHEMLEDAGNPGCNMAVDDGQGQEHERERCDAVEVQTYPITHPTVGAIHVSNFLLDSWQVPGSRGPFTFMALRGLPGYVEPTGPFQTAPSPTGGGNYQLVFPSGSSEMKQVFGKAEPEPPTLITNPAAALRGKPRKPAKYFHWSSRSAKVIRARNARSQAVLAAHKK
jgi:hypothetical protein